jgi:thiol-disulfide isomerase/thioredoxin
MCASLGVTGCVKPGGVDTDSAEAMFKGKASVADVDQFVAANAGKVVLVNVFASWCGYCVQSLPDLVAMRAAYSKGDLAMLGVSLDDASDLPELKRLIKEMNISYPVYMVGDDYAEKHNITGIPVTIIYDRNGKEYRSIMGYTPRAEIEKPIGELLNK